MSNSSIFLPSRGSGAMCFGSPFWRHLKFSFALSICLLFTNGIQPRSAAALGVDLPIQIVTPNQSAGFSESARIRSASNRITIKIADGSMSNLRASFQLYSNGRVRKQLTIGLNRRIADARLMNRGSQTGFSTIELAAVPRVFVNTLPRGVYAHKISVKSRINRDQYTTEAENWIYWRKTDSGVILLSSAQYSSLVERRRHVRNRSSGAYEFAGDSVPLVNTRRRTSSSVSNDISGNRIPDSTQSETSEASEADIRRSTQTEDESHEN